MTDSSTLYKEIVSYLRSDKILESLLYGIYDQVPNNATIPYMYSHFYSLEDVGTFGRRTYKIEIAFFVYCESLQEIVKIAERIRLLNISFFYTQKKYLLSNIKYKITAQEQHFISAISLEAFVCDCG